MDQKVVDSLAGMLRPGQVIYKPAELLTYEMDATNERGIPDGVILLESKEDVTATVKWAAERGIPLIPRGAGTGLSGGAVAEKGGLILEFSRMNRVPEFDALGRSVVVEPGVVTLNLDGIVRKAGLYYPPDPASGRSSTIGGNIAENAGGPHCFKYGVTTNYVTGLEVVLADGQVVRLGGPALDYPGYDFTGILTGSEGTLGIITYAYIRLIRNPPAVKTLIASFDSVESAGEAVSAIIARGLVPATMEFMDQKMMRIIEDYTHAGLPMDAGAALIIEVDGFPESLSSQVAEVVSILKTFTRREAHVAQTAEERDQLWYGRKSAGGAVARLAPAYYQLDGTVPRSRLAQALNATNHICEDLGLRVAYVFHAGDGNLHPFILIDHPDDPAFMKRIFQAGREIMEICVEQGGSISGEHGIGIEKRDYMPLLFAPAELSAMLDLKTVFDPKGLLNPGKIFPEEEQLRGQGRRPSQRKTLSTKPVSSSPQSHAQAVEFVQSSLSAQQPFCIRGGGTKSGLVPDSGQTLFTRKLAGIRAYASKDLYVTVGAGTTLAEVQAALAGDGMWIPLYTPWEEATVGGILASNFNAPLRMRYGGIRDLVLEASVILPDGRFIRSGRPVVKNVAGYDLTKLFIGSYGTLGLITEVTLKLMLMPRARTSLIVPLADLRQGLDLGMKLLPTCFTASALLLCAHCPGFPQAPYTLIYTAEGLREDVAAEILEAEQILKASHYMPAEHDDQLSGNDVWASWLRTNIPVSPNGNKIPTVSRLGVGSKNLSAILDRLTRFTKDASFVADFANGLALIRGEESTGELRQMAHQVGGYLMMLSAPKSVHETVDPWGTPLESLQLMKRLKEKWDKDRLFNPGVLEM